ncbi:CRM-domain containing factor CFM3, chloroplastic/mitochondrial [Coffea arabica]|uniref:CRM-domain containing factor CFM3, chloroplastic/mitochondrial n=1 Tax=Coffea arabica TaxID=13443 RepID=A0A6P6SX93_COFAR
MATSQSPLNFLSQTPFPYPSSSSSQSHFLIPLLETCCLNRALKFKICCSTHSIEIGTQQSSLTRKKRKPRPSFVEQIQDKWSRKPTILIEKLPWEEEEKEEAKFENFEEDEERNVRFSNGVVSQTASEKSSAVSQPVSSGLPEKVILPPWEHGKKPRKKSQFDNPVRNSRRASNSTESLNGLNDHAQNYATNGRVIQNCNNFEVKFDLDEQGGEKGVKDDETRNGFNEHSENYVTSFSVFQDVKKMEENLKLDEEIGENGAKKDDTSNELSQTGEFLFNEIDKDAEHSNNGLGAFQNYVKDSGDTSESVRLPWESESDQQYHEGKRLRKSNTEVAEKVIPEPELKRLRNLALRMVERIKVGAAGVTQALVDSIHEKWKLDEVVKLKFEGPTAMNMRWTHQILESRTGGLVIWRSGSTVVLYRGMGYKLDCVQSYARQTQDKTKEFESSGVQVNNFARSIGTSCSAEPSTAKSYSNNLSVKELKDRSELNLLLDELGPRFKDWSGREPVPVDADLLPDVVPGYRPPFRLLPHGIRHGLRDKEMTFFRRSARVLPPHFALGRNRQLQGLALAMVKLWEKCAIAKIAIKRGVQNTCNERMAEELKVLTGGTLLSRNKEYIVFYRGNDFLPSGVTQALVEKERETVLQQDEEEIARQRALALIASNVKVAERPLVAGTLSETKAATLRWNNQATGEDLEKMMRDSAVAKHAALVKSLENKLAIAKGKITKAEKAVLKVQENFEPAEQPTDLETINDEERFLFRKMGLSMKPYLFLGRRGIFDGTIENMHLHWKYRELVKIFVERKSFPQVKHIAISLEAESGGILVSVDKTAKGYLIIVYRGKNYLPPSAFRPKNLLTRRQALARSIELQRREALKHHVAELQEKIEKLKSELEDMKNVKEIDEETLYSRVDDASDDDELQEDEDEDAYLETYNCSGDVGTS